MSEQSLGISKLIREAVQNVAKKGKVEKRALKALGERIKKPAYLPSFNTGSWI